MIYRTLVDFLNVPEHDVFQVISSHDASALRIDPHYLDIERSAKALIVSVTLNAGRTVDLKKQFYATVVQRLHAQARIRPHDVLIGLTEVPKENWSTNACAGPAQASELEE